MHAAYRLFLSSSDVSSFVCTEPLLDVFSANSLILLCKPVCELLMLAIWLMCVGILRKIEANILNLFEVFEPFQIEKKTKAGSVVLFR